MVSKSGKGFPKLKKQQHNNLLEASPCTYRTGMSSTLFNTWTTLHQYSYSHRWRWFCE